MRDSSEVMVGGASNEAMDALLKPRSIALVGASEKPDSLGNSMVRMIRAGRYGGVVYAINPRYTVIDGISCHAALFDLPETVEHVVLGVGNDRLEAALDAAIAHGAKAATIFASCVQPHDGGALRDRLAAKVRGAGMALCGGNCMGFYNHAIGLRVVGYPAPQLMEAGPIGWLAQSGSVFGALAHNDARLKFSVAISSGAEMVTTAADYLSWMIDQDGIRVVGMFLETVRDPAGFAQALERAAEKNVAVVILKVGRTATSAQMALSHTGAIAGSDAAYQALFRRHGVIQVDDLDEMAATLLLFQQPRQPAAGGLVAIHDSGGERELAVDIAERLGITYPVLSDDTRARVARYIDPELVPMNPLDAWGGAHSFETVFAESFAALLDDPNAALGVMFCDIRDGYFVSTGYAEAALAASQRTDKPVAVATNYAMVRHDDLAQRLTAAGVPVIDGTSEALKAVRHFLRWRDRRPARDTTRPDGVPADRGASWAARLRNGTPLVEDEVLSLIGDYGIRVPARRRVRSADDLEEIGRSLRFPVALKTAEPGILHKSDIGGVQLGIADMTALRDAYAGMARRIGPTALVAEMAPAGIELALGAVVDPQWGPIVMVAAGGLLIELLADRAVALAPLDSIEARSMIDSLRVGRLLDGYRGMPAADREALADTIVRFGWLASDLGDLLSEVDVNPLIVGQHGAVAVDGLAILASKPNAGR
jgi:acyl-CoA synthetase (NDP forming)